MSKKFPFHYEVRFKLLAFDEDNNVRNESFTKVFNEDAPLINRSKAFEEFNEYLTFLESRGGLHKDDKGNYSITQPSFVSEIVNRKVDHLELEEYLKFVDEFKKYREEFSIFLVVNDLSIAKNVLDAFEHDGNIENEFCIHKVASYDVGLQEVVDNLDFYERPLYAYYKIDVSDLFETVYHYGEDYSDSGEDKDDGAKREILRTPQIWTTLEEYEDFMDQISKNAEVIEDDGLSKIVNLAVIIRKGEGNQVEFKPSLLYNFKTGTGTFGIKYIIAKAICGFLNSNGGVLFIGVDDKGAVQGLKHDYSLFIGENEKDKLMLQMDSLIKHFFDISIKPLIDSSIERISGQDIMVVSVTESHKPVFLKNKIGDQIEKEMYIRMHASTRQIIDKEEMIDYVFNKQWKKPNN